MKIGKIVVHVNTHRLTESDFWCEWRRTCKTGAVTSFTQKSVALQ